jgi:3-methyladenine DNA glycosylase AlkD
MACHPNLTGILFLKTAGSSVSSPEIMSFEDVVKDLDKLKDPEKARGLSRFFKTGKGEYGEGDIFLGIPVPLQRKIAKKYPDLSLDNVQRLLSSKMHEHRLVALLILIFQYRRLDGKGKNEIFNFYLQNTSGINNWDLVDLSAPLIIGDYLLTRNKSLLQKLSQSKNLWERRIAIMSTFAFIRNQQFIDTLCIAEMLMHDKHDLIHKAVGWMLREVGKRDEELLEQFLKKYAGEMPRTMLRYAIERFDENKRKAYLKQPVIS